MRAVQELNQNELEELRSSYFHQIIDSGDEEILGDIDCPDDIPMGNVIVHYEDYLFVEDDFFCNESTEISNFTKIKRTIATLRDCYPQQFIDKATISKCLNDKDFQHKYVEY